MTYTHYCEDRSEAWNDGSLEAWELDDPVVLRDINAGVYACGAPASARVGGRWFCEKHLAQAERDYEKYLMGEGK